MLRSDQCEFYRENGYLVVEGLFTAQDCDRIQAVIRRHADPDFAAIMNPDREEFLLRQSPEATRPFGAETASFLRGVMKDARAVAVLEQLQGRPVVGLMSQMLFKEAGSRYADQAWRPHQDNTYPRNPNGQYITTNLFLESADRDNGTMYVYPGSHREPLLEAPPVISYRESDGRPGNPVAVPPQYEEVCVNFGKGDLLVLHGNLIHGSHPNLSATRSRPLLSMSYISEGEEFVPGATAQRMVIPLR
ncbi:MAG: phytanoyl-CoA dioxygenase family protein [Alphaproteobacteria bacterium]|nr:phytanoyl-CoA dioxygenase family protein [Alphaproteobacteria bacterium]